MSLKVNLNTYEPQFTTNKKQHKKVSFVSKTLRREIRLIPDHI